MKARHILLGTGIIILGAVLLRKKVPALIEQKFDPTKFGYDPTRTFPPLILVQEPIADKPIETTLKPTLVPHVVDISPTSQAFEESLKLVSPVITPTVFTSVSSRTYTSIKPQLMIE